MVDDSNLKSSVRALVDMWGGHQQQLMAQSFVFLEKLEKRRRLKAVIALSTEYSRILETTHRATAWCEIAIKHLIEGSLSDVQVAIDVLTFAEEGEAMRAYYVPIFEKFRAMATAAIQPEEQIQ